MLLLVFSWISSFNQYTGSGRTMAGALLFPRISVSSLHRMLNYLAYSLGGMGVEREACLLVFIFWSEMCFSSCLRSFTSAPYFPVVPLSARMKWECMLLRTVSLLMGLDMVWYGRTTCRQQNEADVREEKRICETEDERDGKKAQWSSGTVRCSWHPLSGVRIEEGLMVKMPLEGRLFLEKCFLPDLQFEPSLC